MYFWSAREDLNLRPPTPHDGAWSEKLSPLCLFDISKLLIHLILNL